MKRGISVPAVIGAGALLVAALAAGAIGSKPHYVTVDHGQIGGDSWELAIAGHRGKRCYRQKLSGSGFDLVGVECRPDRRPPANWNPLGGVGDGDARVSVTPFVTKKRVHRVSLRIEHPHSHRKHWVRMNTHRMSFAQAREARVKRNFRFLNLETRGSECLTKVIMFDGSGSRIRALRLPCYVYKR